MRDETIYLRNTIAGTKRIWGAFPSPLLFICSAIYCMEWCYGFRFLSFELSRTISWAAARSSWHCTCCTGLPVLLYICQSQIHNIIPESWTKSCTFLIVSIVCLEVMGRWRSSSGFFLSFSNSHRLVPGIEPFNRVEGVVHPKGDYQPGRDHTPSSQIHRVRYTYIIL